MSVDLLERTAELAALERLVNALVDDRAGAVALISGAAGIGKTRLLEAAVEAARRRGATALTACGTELEADLTFGGVRDLFASMLISAGEAERQELMRGPAALAAPALGLQPVRGGLGDPLFGLYWLAVNLAERAPLLLAVDDLHWLDEESARFAAYLARRITGVPVLLVAAARPPDAGNAPVAVVAALAQVIAPAPLTVEAVATLAGARGRDGAGAELHRLTDGNPFLVQESLRGVRDPTALSRGVLDRIASISANAVALARAVALFAAGARLSDAAAVAGLDDHAAELAADGLVAAGVLGHGELLTFLHPVMRAAVDEAAGEFTRRSAHARAAVLLRERGASAEEIAPHLLASEPQGAQENVEVLVEAAAAARAAAAPRAAARYLERALAEPPADRAQRAALGHELGRLQAMTGHPGAETTLRRALDEAAPDAAGRADIAVDVAACCFGATQFEAAVEVLLPVRGRGELDAERRLLVDGVLAAAAWEAGDGEHYVAVADALPRDLPGDTPGQRLALSQLVGRMMDDCAPCSDALAMALRAIGPDAAPLAVTGIDLGDPMWAIIACGALDQAAALLEDRQAHARDAGHEALFAASQIGLARISRFRGDLRGAEAHCRLGLELPGLQTFDRRALTEQLLASLIRQGRLEDAQAVVDADPILLERSRARFEAQIAVEAGNARDALPALEAARRLAEQLQSRNPADNWQWLVTYIRALHLCDRTSEALALVAEWLPRAERFAQPMVLGGLLALRGQLRGGQEGMDDLRRAVDLLDDSPFAYERTSARLELGAAMRRSGRRADAREVLRAALDQATRMSALGLASRAEAELRATGAKPRRAALTGVDALTPSELRIARLAAAGRSNREIAQHLFLTINTVDSHLRSVFRKLDLSSRTQLADALGDAD